MSEVWRVPMLLDHGSHKKGHVTERTTLWESVFAAAFVARFRETACESDKWKTVVESKDVAVYAAMVADEAIEALAVADAEKSK